MTRFGDMCGTMRTMRSSETSQHQFAQVATVVFMCFEEHCHSLHTAISLTVNKAPISTTLVVVMYDRIRELQNILFFIKDSLKVADDPLPTRGPICEMRKGLGNL